MRVQRVCAQGRSSTGLRVCVRLRAAVSCGRRLGKSSCAEPSENSHLVLGDAGAGVWFHIQPDGVLDSLHSVQCQSPHGFATPCKHHINIILQAIKPLTSSDQTANEKPCNYFE